MIIFIFSLSQSFLTFFGLKWSCNGIFEFFWICLLFFCNFLLRVGQEWNRMITFIFSLSQSFPTYFGLKWSRIGIFEFLKFFAIFLKFSITGWVGMKRNDNFYYLLLSLSQPILAWNESVFVFFNFLEFACCFFGIFYCGSGRNETEW